MTQLHEIVWNQHDHPLKLPVIKFLAVDTPIRICVTKRQLQVSPLNLISQIYIIQTL